MNHLPEHKTLSEAEEQSLAQRIESGDLEAVHTLIRHNVRFAGYLAGNQCRKYGVDPDTALSTTLNAVTDAAYHFKPDTGRFAGHVVTWLKNRSGKENENRNAVRIPSRARQTGKYSVASIFEPVKDHPEQRLIDTLAAPEEPDERPHQALVQTIRKLPFVHRVLIYRLYYRGLSLNECAELYQVSSESVRKRREKAFRELRVLLAADRATEEA